MKSQSVTTRPKHAFLRTIAQHTRRSVLVSPDATTTRLAAPAMSFKLTMGMSPF